MFGILKLVREVKEGSVHLASKGYKYRSLLEQLSVPPQVALFIAQKYIEGFGFYFLVGEQNIRVRSISLEKFLAIYDDLLCRATDTGTDQLCGVVDPGVIGDNESHLKITLETVTVSRTHGCLVADLTNSGIGSQIHSVVDKLVGLGYLEKQSINPIAKTQRSRIDSKAVVLHNKRYVSHYDDEADGVKLVYGTSYLDKIHAMIISVLEKRNVLSMPAREMAKHLGISRWDMQALRNATFAQDKKEPSRVRFFQATGSIVRDSGIVGPETVMWFVGIVGENSEVSGSAQGRKEFTCFTNFPVHETVSSVLESGDKLCTGLTAADIRALTGASYKRAAKLFAEFHKTFGYPLEKVQDGKQLKYRVLPKRRAEVTAAAASMSFRTEEPTGSTPSSESAAAQLFSDQQLLNCGFIEDFLRQRGGVSSFDEIVTAVRVESRRRQREHVEPSEQFGAEPPSTMASNTTMDRRTIARTLALLEHSLQRVYTGDFAADLETPPVSLVLLRGSADMEHRLVDDYFARQREQCSTGPTVMSGKGSAGSRQGHRRKMRQVVDASSDSDISGSEDESESDQDSKKATAKGTVADDQEASGDEGGSDGESEGEDDEGRRKGGNESRALLPDDHNVRKRARLRSLQQRKRNDDPTLFDMRLELPAVERPGFLEQVAGTLISAVCLHFHLLELSPAIDGVASGEGGHETQTSLSFTVNSIARHLPFEYYFKTSGGLQRVLESTAADSTEVLSELNVEVGRALQSRQSLGGVLEESSVTPPVSVLSNPLRSFMRDDCEKELVAVLCLLGAVGVLKPKDLRALDRVASVVLADLLGRNTEAIYAQARDAVPSELDSFVTLFTALTSGQCECAAQVRQLLLVLPFEVPAIPVGSWQTVRSATDVYHHWRTVVLPSLPVDWAGLHFDLPLPNLALHLLRYWEVERSAELPPDTPRAQNRTLFSGGKVKMDLWGNASLRAAWERRAVDQCLSWLALLTPSFRTTDSVTTAQQAEHTLFSLDMPRHTVGRRRKRERERHHPYGGPAAADSVVGDLSSITCPRPHPASKRPRGRPALAPEPPAADDGGDLCAMFGAAEPRCDIAMEDIEEEAVWGGDEDLLLREELAVLCQDATADGSDWTVDQMALMVEVVLTRYFCREQRAELLPGVLRNETVARDARCFIPPGLSVLDLKWDGTDFSVVSDGALAGLIATSGLPDQRMSKHRVIQFLRSYPAARDAVAWVICCRGRRVSSAFARVINAILSPSRSANRSAQQQVWTLLMQSFTEDEQCLVDKRHLERLKAFPFNVVAQVTREMVVRGVLRQRTDCGSAACRTQNDVCPHSKRAFELSDRFEETQRGVAWGDFHRALLKRGGEGLGHLTHHDKLQRSSDIALSAASTSCRLLAVLQILSSGPSHLQTSLALRHELPAPEGELCRAEVRGGDLDTALIGATSCQKHTGFCEAGLNGITVDLFGGDAAAAAAVVVSASAAALETAEAGEDMPWEWREPTENGPVVSVNADLLRLFAEKVLSVLAQRPGSDASAIHAALQVLSAAQAQRLLDEMAGRGWVQHTVAAVTTKLVNPFSRSGSCRGPPPPPVPVYFKI